MQISTFTHFKHIHNLTRIHELIIHTDQTYTQINTYAQINTSLLQTFQQTVSVHALSTHPITTLPTTHSINTPCQLALYTHPLNWSFDPIITPYHCFLPTRSLNTPYQLTFSTNPPYHYFFSTHPINRIPFDPYQGCSWLGAKKTHSRTGWPNLYTGLLRWVALTLTLT